VVAAQPLVKTDRGPVSTSDRLGTSTIRTRKSRSGPCRHSRLASERRLIAAEVRKGNEMLRLRDDQGLPLWRGWR
jgi:hypothetical protein